jgi:hypothetical protein
MHCKLVSVKRCVYSDLLNQNKSLIFLFYLVKLLQFNKLFSRASYINDDLEEFKLCIFSPEDGGNLFVRNIGPHIKVHRATHSRRLSLALLTDVCLYFYCTMLFFYSGSELGEVLLATR